MHCCRSCLKRSDAACHVARDLGAHWAESGKGSLGKQRGERCFVSGAGGAIFSLAFVVDHHRLVSSSTTLIDENPLHLLVLSCLHPFSSFPTLNMSNGIVNGTGLENSFGQYHSFLAVLPPVSHANPRISSASLGINGTKSAYVPPHLRNVQPRAASTPAVPTNGYVSVALCYVSSVNLIQHNRNGWNDSRSSTPSFRGGLSGGPRGGGDGGYGGRSFSGYGRGGGPGGDKWGDRPQSNGYHSAPRSGDGGPRESFGYGIWRDGKHIPGGRNMRMEKELFGDENDPSKQHTGINFEKYDDIPVEATGAGVPDPVTQFTNPPLDPVLLENIGYARYTTPTPVQKYSIPIVAAGRDLMACAQVCIVILLPFSRCLQTRCIRRVLGKQADSYSQSYRLPSPTDLVLLPWRRRPPWVTAAAARLIPPLSS